MIRWGIIISLIIFVMGTSATAQNEKIAQFSSEGIIYPPYTLLFIETIEYTALHQVNNLGFRGENIDLDQRSGCRVVLLGDSYTFSYGVNNDQTWGYLLEQQLEDTQVLNLAIGGAGPATYVVVAQMTFSEIKPDVVIVGVSQGDDLMQAGLPALSLPSAILGRPEPSQKEKVLQHLAPDLMRLGRVVFAAEIRQLFINVSESILSTMPADLYASLDPELIQLWKAGRLSPGALGLVSSYPTYLAEAIDLADKEINIRYLADQLQEIADLEPSTQVIVLALPRSIYISQEAWEASRRTGLAVTDEMLTTTAMDDPIAQSVQQAGRENLSFASFTDVFRASNQNLFFPLDGHLSLDGNRLLAESLAPVVQEKCDQVHS